MTHCTVAGMILTDLILGKNNPWVSLYDPLREPRKKPNATDEQEGEEKGSHEGEDSTNKEDEEDKTSRTSSSYKELLSGQGTVVEDKKIALYKDDEGILHTYSAVCTHMGCTVTWNNLEKSFDCPCHGSRFSASSGNVVNGPANSGLEPKGIPEIE
jgi:Rieske Fe-S protein